jgi:hypothetical protein
MAKKATTIVLILVVVFLLASTVYVSIILTSDTGTTPKNAKASEIDTSLKQVSNSAVPAELGSAPVNNGISGATDSAQPTTIAYANPSPTGAAGEAQPTTTDSQGTPSPTGDTTSPTPQEISAPDTGNLPETGLGQPTIAASASPSITKSLSPTMMVSDSGSVTPIPVAPETLPVAGAMTTTIMAVVAAGLTIFIAFLF